MTALDWSTARTNLIAWAGADYGLGTIDAVWRDTAADSAWFGRVRAVLDLVSLNTIGTDEVTYTNAAAPVAGGELDVTVTGQRTITLEVRIEAQDQRAGYDAIAFMEKLRSSFRLPSVNSSLSEAGLSFNSILAEFERDDIYQQRRHSFVQMDVLMNAASELADSAETYIETFDYETEFLGPDGLPIAHQLSGNLDLIP